MPIWGPDRTPIDILTLARPVRANPARAAGASSSPCLPPLQPRDHTHADRVRASDLRQRLAVAEDIGKRLQKKSFHRGLVD